MNQQWRTVQSVPECPGFCGVLPPTNCCSLEDTSLHEHKAHLSSCEPVGTNFGKRLAVLDTAPESTSSVVRLWGGRPLKDHEPPAPTERCDLHRMLCEITSRPHHTKDERNVLPVLVVSERGITLSEDLYQTLCNIMCVRWAHPETVVTQSTDCCSYREQTCGAVATSKGRRGVVPLPEAHHDQPPG